MLIKRTGALLEEDERFFLIQVALKDSTLNVMLISNESEVDLLRKYMGVIF